MSDLEKHMVNRFLAWKLPDNFQPDAGISFNPVFNEHTEHPARHEPSGTNLFDFNQATEMVQHLLEGAPANPVQDAIDVAVQYGGIDGGHHKDWVIDQMVRALAGDDYERLVREAKDGADGPETYSWNEGIAP